MDENLVKNQELKVNKEVKHDENLNVEEERKNLYVPLTPEEAVRVQNMTKSRLADSFKQAKERKLDTGKINKNSVVKSVTRVTKKRFLKSDETVTENVYYYGSSEKLAEERANNAELLRIGSFAEKDAKADYRMSTDIKVKSRAGYQAFVQLSQFYPAMLATGMNREQFDEMVVKYGKKEGTPERFEVLDRLTDRIMGINPSDFDFTSDKVIAQKASHFESMNSMVSAYREMLEDNPHYVEHLKKTKNENEADSYYDKLTKQMSILCAMSDYYRIRTMIMKDSEYIVRGGDIEQEINKSDSKGTKHLKEMLRASYHIAANLNRILGKNEIKASELSEGKSKLSKAAFKATDNAFMINAKDILEARVEKNMSDSEAYLQQEDRIRDELERLRIEGDRIADYKTRNCLGKLDDISRTVEVYDQKEKKYKKKKVRHANSFIAVYGGALSVFLDTQIELDAQKEQKKRPDMRARIHKIASKMYNDNLSHEAHFDSRKHPELKTVDLGDNIARMIDKIYLDISEDLSDNEIIELVERELAQNSKDYLPRYLADQKRANKEELTDEEKNLEPIGKDEYEYYEDSFIDAAMRNLARAFALFEKVEQSLGAKAFILTPTDFAIKYPDEVVQLVNSALVITNIISGMDDRKKLKSFINRYNETYAKRNKYRLDTQKFLDSADLYGSITFKFCFFKYARYYLINLYNQSIGKKVKSHEGSPETCKNMYSNLKDTVGDLGITAAKIDECYEAHKDDFVVKEMMANRNLKQRTVLNEDDNIALKVTVYMYYHPEVMNEDMLNNITTKDLSVIKLSAQPIEAFKKAYKHGYVHDFTKADLDAYKKSLKEREAPYTNYNLEENLENENDPYDLQGYYDILEEEEREKEKAKEEKKKKKGNT